MKKDVCEMEKNKNITGILFLSISIIIFIITFITGWYADQILDEIFIFTLFVDGFIILFNIVFIIFSLISRKINKSKWILISAIIVFLSLMFRFFFPFRIVKTNLELYIFEDERLEIIESIKKGELIADEYGNVELPKKFKKISSSGEISVYQNDENGQVIAFWIFRGMLSGSTELYYSTGGEKLIWENETGHPIISIKKLKDNWYYVITDY